MTKYYSKKKLIFLFTGLMILAALNFILVGMSPDEEFRPVPLKSKITRVQPMTGIVLWEELDHKDTDAIQLEYSYMRYNDVVREKGLDKVPLFVREGFRARSYHSTPGFL